LRIIIVTIIFSEALNVLMLLLFQWNKNGWFSYSIYMYVCYIIVNYLFL